MWVAKISGDDWGFLNSQQIILSEKTVAWENIGGKKEVCWEALFFPKSHLMFLSVSYCIGELFYYWKGYISSCNQPGLESKIITHCTYCNDFLGRKVVKIYLTAEFKTAAVSGIVHQ